MKNIHLIIGGLLTVFFLFSCGGKKSSKEAVVSEAKEVTGEKGDELVVHTAKSAIYWKGFKPGGSHHGTLSLVSGQLFIQGEELLAGEVELDMTSIKVEDLEPGELHNQLLNHLKSADFFDVETYPKGLFTITSAKKIADESYNYEISGNLSLKDQVKNITFKANIIKDLGFYVATTEKFTIDRTLWGVNYGSKNIFKNLKDAFIEDDIEISIRIVASLPL